MNTMLFRRTLLIQIKNNQLKQTTMLHCYNDVLQRNYHRNNKFIKKTNTCKECKCINVKYYMCFVIILTAYFSF